MKVQEAAVSASCETGGKMGGELAAGERALVECEELGRAHALMQKIGQTR